MCQTRHLRHVTLLFFAFHFPSCNMGLQALVEVQHAADSQSDGGDDEDDGDNRKRGQ